MKLEDTPLGKASVAISDARHALEASWDAWWRGQDDHSNCSEIEILPDPESLGMVADVSFEPDAGVRSIKESVDAWVAAPGVSDLLRSLGVARVTALLTDEHDVDVTGYDE
jgi:hypothetical protein